MIPTNTPDALRLAGAIEQQAKRIRESAKILGLAEIADDDMVLERASEELRRLHAEVERLNSCLQWEQNRANRMGTHGEDCWKWGPAHYECALREVEKLRQVQGGEAVAWADKAMELATDFAVESLRLGDYETRKNLVGYDKFKISMVKEKREAAREKLRQYLYTCPPLQADACKVPQVEKELRRMLCACYSGPSAYMDDGEAQDAKAHPFIDFMRDTPEEIQRKMFERGIAMLSASPAAPTQVERAELRDHNVTKDQS